MQELDVAPETQVLSLVPAFDLALAADLISLVARFPDHSSVRLLSRAGAIEGGPEVWGVVEPLKKHLSRQFWETQPEMYRTALQRFVKRADNGLSRPLARYLGTGAVRLQVNFS